MKKIFKEKSIVPLIGNEAVALGAIEAGISYATAFPGTPSSEVGNLLYKAKESYGFKMEYSVNEIVALETAAGVAFSGLRAIAAMKHFGANVAMDALIPIAYTKPRAGLVLVIADDPGCHSSAQSEQDSRVFAKNLYVPILEPSTPQEAKDFTKLAFEISEKFKKLVIIRLTTRVSHQSAPVRVGKFRQIKKIGKFIKDLKRFNTMPPIVFEQKKELLELEPKFSEYINKAGLNKIIGKSQGKIGLITSGVSHLYALEALKNFGISLPILKIESFYPFPKKKIESFIKNKDKVLVLEEVIGLIEEETRILAQKLKIKTKIFGKDIITPVNEMNTNKVESALAKVLGKKYQEPRIKKINLIKRTPKFCPGCPYWAIFGTLQRVLNKKKIVFTGDIGCYMMGYFPPFEMQDTLLCMGASLGLAHGISKATKQKVVAMIGDSTFFHAGMPQIVNILNNSSNPLIIVFENNITAMTGRQPHPGTPLSLKKHDGKAEVKIENVLKAMGVKNLVVVDPIKENDILEKKIKEFLPKKEASVIVCRHNCAYISSLEKMEIKY